jgi:hypothetical protein
MIQNRFNGERDLVDLTQREKETGGSSPRQESSSSRAKMKTWRHKSDPEREAKALAEHLSPRRVCRNVIVARCCADFILSGN